MGLAIGQAVLLSVITCLFLLLTREGNATNPYTNQTLGYAGFVPINDYITDTQVPQMEAIADLGTEIMWCDIVRTKSFFEPL
jgi:hypothetical protein